MFGAFSTLIALAQLFAAVVLLVLVVGIIILHPLGGLAGLFLFALFCSRVVHRWTRGGR
jgi:hypothetical protein